MSIKHTKARVIVKTALVCGAAAAVWFMAANVTSSAQDQISTGSRQTTGPCWGSI